MDPSHEIFYHSRMRTDPIGWQTPKSYCALHSRRANASEHAAISCVQNSVMSFLPTKILVCTRYVQFTYFMGRVYC